MRTVRTPCIRVGFGAGEPYHWEALDPVICTWPKFGSVLDDQPPIVPRTPTKLFVDVPVSVSIPATLLITMTPDAYPTGNGAARLQHLPSQQEECLRKPRLTALGNEWFEARKCATFDRANLVYNVYFPRPTWQALADVALMQQKHPRNTVCPMMGNSGPTL